MISLVLPSVAFADSKVEPFQDEIESDLESSELNEEVNDAEIENDRESDPLIENNKEELEDHDTIDG